MDKKETPQSKKVGEMRGLLTSLPVDLVRMQLILLR